MNCSKFTVVQLFPQFDFWNISLSPKWPHVSICNNFPTPIPASINNLACPDILLNINIWLTYFIILLYVMVK